MSITVEEGVRLARAGKNPELVAKLETGWLVLASNMQYLKGYCILLADPVVPSLNDLSIEERAKFLKDMTLVGDALQRVTGAYRINYGIMGNTDPALHAHIVPRYLDEPEEYLHNHPWAYPSDVMSNHIFNVEQDRELIGELSKVLRKFCYQ